MSIISDQLYSWVVTPSTLADMPASEMRILAIVNINVLTYAENRKKNTTISDCQISPFSNPSTEIYPVRIVDPGNNIANPANVAGEYPKFDLLRTDPILYAEGHCPDDCAGPVGGAGGVGGVGGPNSIPPSTPISGVSAPKYSFRAGLRVSAGKPATGASGTEDTTPMAPPSTNWAGKS